MDEHVGTVDRARTAIDRGAWQEAFDLLRSLGSERSLSPSELDLLGQAAYGAGELEAAISAWEQAHRALAGSGDDVAAAKAAVTVAMYLMMDTGLMAPVRGWLARAESLLVGYDEEAVHAWLAMVGTYERLLSGDVSAADRYSEQAIEIGTRHGVPGPVAVSKVAQARIRILNGEVQGGLALLDEAAVTTVSGDLDPLTAGMVYCELICAMQGLAQYDRAEQWTDAMRRWRHSNAIGGMSGRCRVHHAEILRLRGSCVEAEKEALRACEELRPWMRREFGWPLTELASIRLRKGDLDGAERALLAAHECGWDPQPGLAMVRLAQGEVAAASALIGDALDRPRRVPSKERPPAGRLPRAPLLDAQVEIALAAGDTATAEHAAAELEEIARTYLSRALIASASLARGRVALARGQAEAAASACDDAVGIWSEVGAPYEASVARMVLAEAHRACGRDDRALLEWRAARSTFEKLGAGLRAREAARAPARESASESAHESAMPTAAGTVANGVFRRDGEMRTVGFGDSTVVLRDLKGMRYLARLLAEPAREFHVLDLVASEKGASPAVPAAADDALAATYGGDLGPTLDEQAVQAYKRRLSEIDEDLDEAARMGDTARVELASAERDYLVSELSRAYGIGGRHRPTGSNSERARASVTRAVRYALVKIGEHHTALAAHLQHAVRTGTYCSYTPDPRVPTVWHV